MPESASLTTLVLSFVAVFAALMFPASISWNAIEFSEYRSVEKQMRIRQYQKIAKLLYVAGADDQLVELLQNGLRLRDYDYFLIRKDGAVILSEPPESVAAKRSSYAGSETPEGPRTANTESVELQQPLASDYALTIGIDTRKAPVMAAAFQDEEVLSHLLQGLIVLSTITWAAIWLHTRDLRSLSAQINRSGRLQNDGRSLPTNSSEGQTLLASIRGYSQVEQTLKKKSDRLSAQVLPALQRELFNGKAPPYSFECTLVRTDINGFTGLIRGPFRDLYFPQSNDFFTGLTEILSRYDGLIYQFIGDEAVYYFKDDETEPDPKKAKTESINRAIYAIRDIHELAKVTNEKTQRQGYRFTVKSSLSHDTVTFRSLVDGFTFSGDSLVDTVRALSEVERKEQNTLLFSSKHLPYLHTGHEFKSLGSVKFKGYDTPTEMVEWISAINLNQRFASRAPESPFDFVSHHRTDSALESIISTAAAAGNTWSISEHVALVQALKEIRVYRAEHKLAPALLSWLRLARDFAVAEPGWNKLVSAIVMIFQNLVLKEDLRTEDQETILSLIEHPDARTAANAIFTATAFEVPVHPEVQERLFKHPNNRLAANALIYEGSQRLTDRTLKGLETMILNNRKGLSKHDNARSASGLYALGEIIRLMRARDEVYYLTRIELHRLVARVRPLVQSENSSVARQAKRAIDIAETQTGT